MGYEILGLAVSVLSTHQDCYIPLVVAIGSANGDISILCGAYIIPMTGAVLKAGRHDIGNFINAVIATGSADCFTRAMIIMI